MNSIRELQKIKYPKRSFVVTDQRSNPVIVGAQCAGPPEGLRIAPLHIPLNGWMIYILQSP
ncbi:hypothetical protein Oscil6304_2570 [Oscillatoria acuminata PCC 6304]|uniref:Uncharacterized protein n=1 Tax=Oscillatoria acuminata PCC 6304 TaxID=56110 RepID=K9TH27_9CYAN|nr:hypothetical protein Oscil6304_2570 [Oscillatoria acuminata PCC 6304]